MCMEIPGKKSAAGGVKTSRSIRMKWVHQTGKGTHTCTLKKIKKNKKTKILVLLACLLACGRIIYRIPGIVVVPYCLFNMETCSNPGCDQPGTNKCSGCKSTPYCGPTCQKAHWAVHKESCDGHLRKMGMAHLDKARGFNRENNWPQLLRCSDLAATKLKQLKDRPVEDISESLSWKCIALDFLGQHREQLECAKEWYCLWNTKPTDMGAIRAAFALISSCMQNKEYTDAVLYASTLYEIINHKHDNKIPDDQRQHYIARGAYFLALGTLRLAQAGGIPPEEKHKAGQEAIALARRALEIHTQLHGTEDVDIASDMCVLAEALDRFPYDDDEEVLRLYQQSKAIFARVYSSSSVNVAVSETKLGIAYCNRAARARTANDLERYVANLELALPHIRESARIYRILNRVDNADKIARTIIVVEERLRHAVTVRASAAAAAAAVTRG